MMRCIDRSKIKVKGAAPGARLGQTEGDVGGRGTGLPPAPPAAAQGAGDAKLQARRGGRGPESRDARPQRSLPTAIGDSTGSTLLWDRDSCAFSLA